MMSLFKHSVALLALPLLLVAGTAHGAEATAADDGLVLLPGGTFFMGSPETERQRDKDEMRHRVSVSAFYVDPHEVTQEDYTTLMGENPSAHKGERLPVENVTWLTLPKPLWVM